MLPVTSAFAVAFLWAGAWFVNASALAENRTLLQAVSPQSSGILTNLAYFEKAISYGAIGTQEVREQLVQAASSLVSATNVSADAKQQFFDAGIKEMTLQSHASALDARFPLFIGILYDANHDYANGAVALAKAHELSPDKQSILYEVGTNAYSRGDAAGALSAFKTAFELEESNIDARLFYAAIAIRTKQDALADQILAPALVTGQAADPRIAAAYASRGLYGKIVEIWKAHVKAQPDEAQGYFTLSAAYYAAGDSASAIRTLQEIAQKDSSVASQAGVYIDQIKNGTMPRPQ
jgi:cytochrome c-type biogenesis protein CcmH/NrfG